VFADVEKTLDTLVRPVAIIAGGAYGLGVVIINLYLSRHGVYSGTLLRTEYVLAGLLWGFLALFAYCHLAGASELWRQVAEACASRHFLFAGLSGALIVLWFTVLPISFMVMLGGETSKVSELPFYYAVGTAFLSASQVSGLVKALRDAGLKVDSAKPQRASDLLFAILQVTWVVATITAYSILAYPHLPAAIGGGKRSSVYVVLSSQTPAPLLRVLPRNHRAAGLVGPVSVVLENDREIYVLPNPLDDAGKAIMISRECVKGLIPCGS
jgi:hypothetical protein